MAKHGKLIRTENGTVIGRQTVTDSGEKAVTIKSGNHYDTVTAEMAASLIAGKPVMKIVYADVSAS